MDAHHKTHIYVCESNDYIFDCSPHCMCVHVAQDNYYFRDLIDLESATLSNTVCVVL